MRRRSRRRRRRIGRSCDVARRSHRRRRCSRIAIRAVATSRLRRRSLIAEFAAVEELGIHDEGARQRSTASGSSSSVQMLRWSVVVDLRVPRRDGRASCDRLTALMSPRRIETIRYPIRSRSFGDETKPSSCSWTRWTMVRRQLLLTSSDRRSARRSHWSALAPPMRAAGARWASIGCVPDVDGSIDGGSRRFLKASAAKQAAGRATDQAPDAGAVRARAPDRRSRHPRPHPTTAAPRTSPSAPATRPLRPRSPRRRSS